MASVHVWNIGDKLSSAVRYTFLVLIAINKRVSWDRTTTFTSTGVFQTIPVEVVLSEYKPPAVWLNVQEQQTLVTFSVQKN
jgi:hypothetical protein